MDAVLKVSGLCKSYGKDEAAQEVLRGVDFELAAGERCMLMGPSGSGKTTLLSCLGCLLTPTAGTLEIGGQHVHFSSRESLEVMRKNSVGFVFQHAQLLPFLSAVENVEFVARNAGMERGEIGERVGDIFDRLGIASHAGKYPRELSGGQRQRVAIARGIVHRPEVVLADEPTAALDWKVGQQVIEMLVQQTRESGVALLVVTHDHRLERYFDRHCEIVGGRMREMSAERKGGRK